MVFREQFAAGSRTLLHGSRQLRLVRTERRTFFTYGTNYPDGADIQYDLSVPVNAQRHVQGVELNYQQAMNDNFGFAANYTYADGKQTSQLAGRRPTGRRFREHLQPERLLRELELQRARHVHVPLGILQRPRPPNRVLAGRHRFAGGFARVHVNENYTITLDGQNLNNPHLKYFALDEDQPRAFYKNGTPDYLNLRVKF